MVSVGPGGVLGRTLEMYAPYGSVAEVKPSPELIKHLLLLAEIFDLTNNVENRRAYHNRHDRFPEAWNCNLFVAKPARQLDPIYV